MKLWLAMSPNDANRHRTFCIISGSAICPPRTIEMQQDCLEWYEIEVLRKMEIPVMRDY